MVLGGAQRYVLNNLSDGRTQDRWDLFLGRYIPRLAGGGAGYDVSKSPLRAMKKDFTPVRFVLGSPIVCRSVIHGAAVPCYAHRVSARLHRFPGWQHCQLDAIAACYILLLFATDTGPLSPSLTLCSTWRVSDVLLRGPRPCGDCFRRWFGCRPHRDGVCKALHLSGADRRLARFACSWRVRIPAGRDSATGSLPFVAVLSLCRLLISAPSHPAPPFSLPPCVLDHFLADISVVQMGRGIGPGKHIVTKPHFTKSGDVDRDSSL